MTTNGTGAAAGAGRPLVVEGLRKSYLDRASVVRAVDGVDFHVGEGEFYSLLGPSGCGKTTTLRCVAGLEHTDVGRITVNGVVVADTTAGIFVPPNQRDIGMVFQSYGIWPHMTVFKNVSFPLDVVPRRQRLGKKEIRALVEEALAAVQLAGYEGRMATQLSGGQQQRLALARALVRRPQLLLLDEPLSNLDAKLRHAMREEVRGLQRQLGVTTLYVTHDQAEALSMSTRIAVMDNGRIEQEGSPRQIYDNPATSFVADFVGNTNFLAGEVLAADGDAMQVDTPLGGLRARCPDGTAPGEPVTLAIRPENLIVHPEVPAASANVVPVTVESVLFLGEAVDVRTRVGDCELVARQSPHLDVAAGQQAWLEVPIDRCAVIHDQRGTARGEVLADPATATDGLEAALP